MCGIFGCVGKIDKERAKVCIEKIKHRGPDALGVKELHGATLAHARLSIIDTSDHANQPLCSEDKRYWIIFNGEIYNFVEIRKELELLGWRFRTQSDTEVALYAYVQWGENFQHKCNGMWAMAIWDDFEKVLFLSRDRFGVKPLYWYENNGNFYFASEMKALFPIMHERKPNLPLFNPYRAFGYETTDECVIRNIKRFQPACCAVYKEGQLKLRQWWSTLDNLMEVPKRYEEQVEYLRELFLDAVKIRMRSDVPIGTALSGGVDSSSIVGVMNSLFNRYSGGYFCNDWQHAFVASMPGAVNDETTYAKMAADYVGLEVRQVMISPPASVDELINYVYMSEEPYDTALIPHFQVYHAIGSNGIKVSLDGEGADELFGGYTFDILEAVQSGGYSEKELIELVQLHNNMTFPEYHVTLQGMKKMALLAESNSQDISGNSKMLDSLNKVLYAEAHRNVLPTILRVMDRVGMASGVEIRMPFLDYRIVGFAFSIPWTSKLRNGYSKAIERDMARPYMDERILNRKLKIGFNDPLTEWFRGPLKEFLLDTVHSRDFIECDLINSLEASVAINEFLQGEEATFSAGHKLWSIIVPYLWKKAVLS